jgi:hypothetical protein
MRACPLCGETYQDFIEFCFRDGEVLVGAAEAGARAGVAGAAASSAQPSAASTAATPVPRAPRRTLLQRKGAPTYGAPDGSMPDLANREDDVSGTPVPAHDTDEDDAPLPPSAVETAPIPRPQRKVDPAVTAPIPIPERVQQDREAAERAAAAQAAASPPSQPRQQLVNTTPKAVTFAGEVVEPESSTMLFAGLGALAVGGLMIVLGIGGMFWFSGMFGADDHLADAGRIVEPAPPPAPPPPLPPPAAPVQPTEVQPAGLPPEPIPAPTEPAPVVPAPEPPAPTEPRPAPAPVEPARPRPQPQPRPDPAPVAIAAQRVRFTSKPTGATVDVAGQTQTTPFEVELGPGNHRWAAQQRNRKPREDVLAIDAPTAEVRVVDVSLAAETRSCFLTATNNVAEVRIEGSTYVAMATVEVPVGFHNVTATLANGETARGTLEVPPAPAKCVLAVQIKDVSIP